MRQVKRSTVRLSLFFTFLVLVIGIYSFFQQSELSSFIFSRFHVVSQGQIVAAQPNVIENVPLAPVVTAESLVKNITPAVLGTKSQWPKGDYSCFGGTQFLNNCQNPTKANIKINKVLEKKESEGINLSSSSSTKKVIRDDPNDPTSKEFVFFCDADGGKRAAVAQVNLSVVPLFPGFTQSTKYSVRNVTDDLKAILPDVNFIRNLPPADFPKFCEALINPDSHSIYYNTIRTMDTYNTPGSAESKGQNFAQAMIAACITRTPGTKPADVAERWLNEEQGIKTVSYVLEIPTDIKVQDLLKYKSLFDAKGLTGVYVDGSGITKAYAWQPKSIPQYMKTAATSVSSKILYDNFSAVPQRSSDSHAKVASAVDGASILSVEDNIRISEYSDETIYAAVTGGMYTMDKSVLGGSLGNSYLFYDPSNASVDQTLCNLNKGDGEGRCPLVPARAQCGGASLLGFYAEVKANINFPQLTVSTYDTQRWSGIADKDTVRANNRTGDKYLGDKNRAPSYLSKATIEQVVMASGKATNTCKAKLQTIIEQQSAQGLGVTKKEFEALAHIWNSFVYWSQGILAAPVHITCKAYMPYLNRLTGKDAMGTGGCDDYIPVFSEIKLDEYWDGVAGLSPTDDNAAANVKHMQDDMAQQQTKPMTDGMVDCDGTKLWLCQTSGDLLVKCQP